MTELLADPAGGLLATRASLDALAGLPPAAATADVAPLLEAWAQPLATVGLRMLCDGAEVDVSGVVGSDLAVLLAPVAAGSGSCRVIAAAPASLPRWIARLTGLGPRPVPAEPGAAVPLTWEGLERCVGRAGADEHRAEEGVQARAVAPLAAVDAILAPGTLRWIVTTAGTPLLRGAGAVLDHQIDVIDAGPRGLWLVVAAPPDGETAAALPVRTAAVWRLLSSILIAVIAPVADDEPH